MDDKIDWLKPAISFVLTFIEDSERREVKPTVDAVLRAMTRELEQHINHADESAR